MPKLAKFENLRCCTFDQWQPKEQSKEEKEPLQFYNQPRSTGIEYPTKPPNAFSLLSLNAHNKYVSLFTQTSLHYITSLCIYIIIIIYMQ